ncbi:MAG: DegT/DnrJ/EryC1/StrS family aminotransferase [Ignavibacteriales bacterium]
MIPFSPPRIDERIIKEVNNTLRSGWITTGPKTKLLEKKLEEYTKCKRCICLNSATAGLELALRWFGVGSGDEVILPAYTYSATANVIIHCGAKPVFADVGNDFNINAQEIKKHITSRTKVIMPVDFAGLPCRYDVINQIVCQKEVIRRFNPQTEAQRKLGRILILSDAAHSLGGWYKGKRTGSLTDITVFSFHAVKNLTTAEGGALCLNLPGPLDNKVIYEQLCIKSLHGQNKDALAKTQAGSWKYDIIEAGYKYNMTDILASIGLVEIERYDCDTLKKRRYIFDRYNEAFRKYEWAELPLAEDRHRESSYHIFAMRIRDISESERDEIISQIFSREVSVNVHFIPVPMMTFYRNQGYNITDYPRAYDLYSREISLPVFYDLKDEQIDMIISAVTGSVETVLALHSQDKYTLRYAEA